MRYKLHPYYLLIIWGLFLLTSNGYGQSSYSKFTKNPEEKALILAQIDSAKTLFENNPMGAFSCVESAITTALKQAHRFELAEGYLTIGDFNQRTEDYNSALLYFEKASEIYKSLNKWQKTYRCAMFQGQAYASLNDLNNAKSHFQSASILALKGEHWLYKLSADFEIATLVKKQNNLTDAIALFEAIKLKAQEKKLTALVDETDLALGQIYEKVGEYDKAANAYNTVQSNAWETKNNDLLNRSNVHIVESFSNGNDNYNQEQINQNLNASEELFNATNDTSLILENSNQKADYYTAQGDVQGAVQQLNYSYSLSEAIGDINTQLATSKKLYDIQVSTDDIIYANQALDNYHKLLDSVNVLKTQKKNEINQNQFALRTIEKQIDNLELERKLDQQTITLLEKEKELDQKALKQQSLLLYIFGFLLLIFVGVSIFVYRNNKARKRANQMLYLKSLRAQMNPHFIFNSLNSVNNYISKSNERAANKYLSKFSKLMRQVLEHSQVEFISLSKEIDVLRLYTELEHERFSDKFDFEFLVDETINTEAYTIPPMLVQPFIENAVWHGLRYKDSFGQLKVHLIDKNDHVEIIVQDDGIGRIKSQEIKTINQKKHNSSGMRNVENRTEMIQAVFKTKIDYKIIDLPDNSGTKVILKLFKNE